VKPELKSVHIALSVIRNSGVRAYRHVNLKDMGLSSSFFGNRFNITERDLERYLDEALSRGGDYADLYFEYLATSNISVDESIVKNATQGVSLGIGVRVIAGERTGYAYSDDLSPEKILKAAGSPPASPPDPPRWKRCPCRKAPGATCTP
jgi:hypothetical protein